MKKFFNRIIVILILYLMLFPYTVTYAATASEAGLYVASYAKNLCEKMQINWSLGYGDYGTINGNVFTVDCVGFVRYVYREAIGYEKSKDGEVPVPSGNNGGTARDTTAGYTYGNKFRLIAINDLSKAMPGDIIESFHHDMIYIGKVNDIDDVVANSGNGDMVGLGLGSSMFCIANKGQTHSTNTFSSHTTMCYGEGGCNFRIWRLTDEFASTLDKSTFNAGGNLVAGKSMLGSSKSNIQMSNFYYNGIPDGKYSVTKGLLERLINLLADIFEFIITLNANIMRMVFVGWTAVIENLITSSVKAAAGHKAEVISTTDIDIDSGDNITVENIVFNKVNIFDVNFFNFNKKSQQNNP